MNNIKGEKNKVNIMKGNIEYNGKNNGNIVYGTQIINNHGKEKNEIEYELIRGKLNINRKFFATIGGSLTFAGLLGVVSSIITILQSFHNVKIPQLSSLFYIFFFVSVTGFIIIYFNFKIKNKKIISILPKSIFGFNLGLFNDDKIARLILKSKCPKENCGGKLNFFYDVQKDKYQFVCSRNSSQHRYDFDFTELKY